MLNYLPHFLCSNIYIIGIPHIPPIPHIHHHAGADEQQDSFVFFETIAHSVVRNIPAREIASSKATLTTFLGSTIQELIISIYLSFDASYQKFSSFDSNILLITTLHSFQAFSTICFIG